MRNDGSHQHLSRRRLLAIATTALGGSALLAACGGAASTVQSAASAASSAIAQATASTPAATSATAGVSTTSKAAATTAATTASATTTTNATTAAAATSAATSTSATAYVANASKSGTAVEVLDGWGTGPWEKQLYDGWTQGVAQALPDLKVEFIMTGDFKGGSDAKTLAMIAAGTPPDLTLGSDVNFAIQGAIVDLKPYFDQDKAIGGWKWYPPCWQYVNIVLDNGHPMLWAFPGNSDARVIYVNLDLFQKAGVAYDPTQHWDWPTFEEHAKALTKRQPDGTIQQLGFSGLWTFGDPYVLAQYAGGNYFALNKTTGWVDKSTFADPGTQKGLAFYRQLMVADKVGLLPDEKFSGSFTAGTVAMQPSWTSFLSSLNPATNPKLQTFKWDVMGYPVENAGDKWPNQFANGSQMGSLVKGAKNLDGAFQVGKYLIGDGHVIRMQAMGGPPIVANNDKQQQIWKQRSAGSHYTEIYDAVMSQGPLGTWSKIKTNSDQIMTIYGNNITQLLKGQMGVSDFAAAMDSAVNPLLQQ